MYKSVYIQITNPLCQSLKPDPSSPQPERTTSWTFDASVPPRVSRETSVFFSMEKWHVLFITQKMLLNVMQYNTYTYFIYIALLYTYLWLLLYIYIYIGFPWNGCSHNSKAQIRILGPGRFRGEISPIPETRLCWVKGCVPEETACCKSCRYTNPSNFLTICLICNQS